MYNSRAKGVNSAGVVIGYFLYSGIKCGFWNSLSFSLFFSWVIPYPLWCRNFVNTSETCQISTKLALTMIWNMQQRLLNDANITDSCTVFLVFSAVANKNKSPRIHGKLSKCSYHPLSLFYLSIYYCISSFPSSFRDQLRLFVVKWESCLLLSCSFSSQNETLFLNSKYVFCQTVIPTCWCYFCTIFWW